MQSLRTTVPRVALGAHRAFSTSTPRSLAKMSLIGRMAFAPELEDTATGRQIVKYVLGVSNGPKDESGNRATSWFRVASFMTEGPARELLLRLPKGSLIHVEADASLNTYGEEGDKRTALNLVQRKCKISYTLVATRVNEQELITRTGNFEVLSTPRVEDSEPMSGAGAA